MATNKLIVITAPCASADIAPAVTDEIFEVIARALGCHVNEVCLRRAVYLFNRRQTMNNNRIFGQRPAGTPARRWQFWNEQFDRVTMPFPMPKNELTREIYLAGTWLQQQLAAQKVPPETIEHECGDLGCSLFMLVTQGDNFTQVCPTPLWDLAKAKASAFGWKENNV